MISIFSKNIYSEIHEEIEKFYDIFEIIGNPILPFSEQTHVDQNICVLRGNVFMSRDTCLSKYIENNLNLNVNFVDNLIKPCSLDILTCGNYFFHNLKYTPKEILEKATDYHYVLVDVHQGYTACTAFYFDKLDLIVTCDQSIINKAREHAFNLYEVPENVNNNILLPGYDHGFIGGCLGYLKEQDVLFVNGSLSSYLPDLYQMIIQTGTKIIETEDQLCDIGGILFI